MEKPINVNERNGIEKPDSEPAPVQRLVMQFEASFREQESLQGIPLEYTQAEGQIR